MLPVTSEQTFLFADLAGFTALTEAHGDDHAADLATQFCARINELLPPSAQYLKSIGDACLVRVEDPPEAVLLGLRLVEVMGAQHGFPAIRAGMHSGPAVQRGGDWFGATVNLAARVAAMARAGEALVTARTHEGAAGLEGVEWIPTGAHELRNVAQPVTVYAARRAGGVGSTGLVLDPVCRMSVEPARRAGLLTHRGAEYSFCSLRCAEAFAGAPDRYIPAPMTG